MLLSGSLPLQWGSIYSLFLFLHTLRVVADNSGYQTYIGCFQDDNSFDDLIHLQQTNASQPAPQSYIYNSVGFCGDYCAGLKFHYAAMGNQATYCYCGINQPSNSLKAADSNCNIGCAGYPADSCGGKGYLSVLLTSYTGAQPVITNTTTSTSIPSSTSTSSNTQNTSTTSGSSTATSSLSPTIDDSNNSGGGLKGGVIAAVVIAVVVACISLILAMWSIVRRSKGLPAFMVFNRNQTELGGSSVPMMSSLTTTSPGMFAYGRNKQDRHGSLGSGYTLNGSTFSDALVGSRAGAISPLSEEGQRIDPNIAERLAHHGSSESLQDDKDYSRKILKVTNPDDII